MVRSAFPFQVREQLSKSVTENNVAFFQLGRASINGRRNIWTSSIFFYLFLFLGKAKEQVSVLLTPADFALTEDFFQFSLGGQTKKANLKIKTCHQIRSLERVVSLHT